jgi:DNA repair ATPase RecN
LITNLVNQNFEELNESVKNLNSWQQQYKNLIQELIGKVDKTVRELDATAQRVQKTQEIAHDKLQAIEDTLSGISSYTEDLVADEGKLAKILEGLTEVLVDENELTRAFDHAVDAMERLRNSSEDFEATKKQITNWLNREQGINGAMTLFNAGVADLTQRLQALQGIKMEDLKLLDNSFNQRLQGALNTSFSHLDALIKEYVGFLEKSRKIEITVNDKSNGKI